PNPHVCGIEELKKQQIEVIVGIEEQKAKELIKEYSVFINAQRPYIALKAGISIDGKLATDQGVSKWINSEKMREYSNSLRGYFDSILVGSNTLLNDNPYLTQRYGKIRKQPHVIVVDSHLKIPLDSNIFKEKSRKFFVITNSNNKDNQIFQNKIKELQKMGVNIIYVDYDHIEKEKKLLNLKQAFEILASQYLISSIAVEGGPTIHSYLIERKLFDEIYLYVGAKIIGGNKYNLCYSVLCNDAISKCINLKLKRIKRIDNDVLLHYEKIN
ncbi:MAG: bifunctional diaminohydroxyphosphoribosylaminopyrimidine deaminase/5-amino-6-(5-phosphoribosylamino)uracil reductase RibD, partial [Candidatus Anstonellales archaeon]